MTCTPEDRAWHQLANELSLPDEARKIMERTGTFQYRVLRIALIDFGAALMTTWPFRQIVRMLNWLGK